MVSMGYILEIQTYFVEKLRVIHGIFHSEKSPNYVFLNN